MKHPFFEISCDWFTWSIVDLHGENHEILMPSVGDSKLPQKKAARGDCAFVGLYGEKASASNGSASVDSFFWGEKSRSDRFGTCFLTRIHVL